MVYDLSENTTINERYRLNRKLGQGGFSVVWLAADALTDTEVAVKIYAPDKGLDQSGLAQFKKEYRRTRGLRHPHLLVPEHLDILQESHSPLLVLPYCPGGSLTDKLHSEGHFEESELARVLAEVAGGLEALHAKKIIHQDIKPDNILIDRQGHYQLTDFGISRQMRSTLHKATANQSYMTVAYSPPERYIANPVDTPASDIFSLGVMCYELATGQLPWDGNGGVMLNAGAQVPNLPEGYSRRLSGILQACMDKQYRRRPTAGQLRKMAEEYLSTGAWPKIGEEKEGTHSEQPNKGFSIRQTEILERPVTEKESPNNHRVQEPNKRKLKILKYILIFTLVPNYLFYFDDFGIDIISDSYKTESIIYVLWIIGIINLGMLITYYYKTSKKEDSNNNLWIILGIITASTFWIVPPGTAQWLGIDFDIIYSLLYVPSYVFYLLIVIYMFVKPIKQSILKHISLNSLVLNTLLYIYGILTVNNLIAFELKPEIFSRLLYILIFFLGPLTVSSLYLYYLNKIEIDKRFKIKREIILIIIGIGWLIIPFLFKYPFLKNIGIYIQSLIVIIYFFVAINILVKPIFIKLKY